MAERGPTSPEDDLQIEMIAPPILAEPDEPGWRGLIRQLRSLWRLTRVTTAFAAVGNAWFVVLWSRAAAPHEPGTQVLRDAPLAWLLACSALSAVSLVGYGAVLNDLLDLKRDRTTRPDRPLASGEITIEQAVWLVATTLMLAVLGAAFFGTVSVVLTLVLALALLLFSAAAKFIPGAGAVLIGLVFAGQMLVPNPNLVFLWPVWLVMTQALAALLLFHTIGRRVPKLSARGLAATLAGWFFWSGALYALGVLRSGRDGVGGGFWVSWLPQNAWVVPFILAVLFAGVVARKVRRASSRQRASEKAWRYGSQWLVMYHAAWCFGAGFRTEGYIMAALAVATITGTTVMRELYSAIDTPLAYRR